MYWKIIPIISFSNRTFYLFLTNEIPTGAEFAWINLAAVASRRVGMFRLDLSVPIFTNRFSQRWRRRSFVAWHTGNDSFATWFWVSWKVEQGEPLPGSWDKRSIASRGDNDKHVSPSLRRRWNRFRRFLYRNTLDARTVLRTLYLWSTTFDFFLRGRTGFSSYRRLYGVLLACKNRGTLETGFSRRNIHCTIIVTFLDSFDK